MLIAIVILWYLIGSVGSLIILYLDDGEITVGCFVMMLTIGGLLGLFTAILTFSYSSFADKRIF